MKKFEVAVTHEHVTDYAKNVDMITLAQVLQRGGLSWDTYTDKEEAKKVAVHLAKKNATMLSYNYKEPDWDEEYPQLSMFFYITSKGKDERTRQTTKKALSQDCPLSSVKQLDDAKAFMEGLGYEEKPIDDPANSSNLVNIKKEELEKKLTSLQLTCLFHSSLHKAFLQLFHI